MTCIYKEMARKGHCVQAWDRMMIDKAMCGGIIPVNWS